MRPAEDDPIRWDLVEHMREMIALGQFDSQARIELSVRLMADAELDGGE